MVPRDEFVSGGDFAVRAASAFLVTVYCWHSLVAESFDRIKARRARRGVETGEEADREREYNGTDSQPQGNIGNFHARQILPVEINGCAPGQRRPDQPTERDTEKAAEKTHSPSFRKEKAAHVAVGCA